MRNIQWNTITWYSQLIAVIVGLMILYAGVMIGQSYQSVILCNQHGVCIY